MRRHLLGVDIGGSKIAVVACQVGTGREVHADKVKTPADAGVEAVLREIDAQVDALPGGSATLAALGVAVPGRVEASGHVLHAGNLDGWVDVPLLVLLEKRYGVPVFVERDANCGAIGEKWRGAAKHMNDFVFLSLGTGVGAGLFLDGQLRRGAHCSAGEVGDVEFGFKDTVGGVLSKRDIKKAAKRATGKEIGAAEALSRATREPRLERATEKVVAYLSSTVVAICYLIDPEAIIFGGGTSKAGDALLRRVRRRLPRQLSRVRLILAGLGTASPIYGALWGASEVLRNAVASEAALDGQRRRASKLRSAPSAPPESDRAPRRVEGAQSSSEAGRFRSETGN